MIYLLPNSFAYTWGSLCEERSVPYPCDRFLSEPDETLYRAISIRAERKVVFRWLCQLRVAPYSYDWIDHHGRRSPRELIPGLDRLVLGQRFLAMFRIVDFTTDEHITLKIDGIAAERMFGDIAMTYTVKSVSDSETRLLVKLLVRRTTDRRFRWIGPLLAWGDWVMMRKQLLTLKILCEKNPENYL